MLIFLFLIQNICCGFSKEPSQWDGSFEHLKHMSKLIAKKIFTILRSKHLSWPMITKIGIHQSENHTYFNSLFTSVICWLPLQQLIPRSGPTKCQAWSGFNLFDTLMVSLKEIFKEDDLEKNQQTTKCTKNYPVGKDLNPLTVRKVGDWTLAILFKGL